MNHNDGYGFAVMQVSCCQKTNKWPCFFLSLQVCSKSPNTRIPNLLRNLGCTSEMVSDGKAACRALKKNDYDVVLMDVHMPKMNGIDATQTIRKEINNQIPIVALTAAAMQEEQAKCFESGMDDIVLKPVNIIELRGKLQAWGKCKERAIESQPHAFGRSPKGMAN